jgi:CRP-like cAMP-binding protein
MKNYKNLVSYINQVVQLSNTEIELLKIYVTERHYLKNQYIIQQGDTCKTESFIVSGCTKTFYVHENGQEHIIMFSVKDWWTADIGSFVSQTPADFNVQCLEDTTVIQFHYDTIDELFEKIPKLERFFRKIIERAFVSSQKRLIRNLSLNAKDRYVHFKTTYPEINQRIPQYMIASYLGITKEFFSKIKNSEF